MTENDREVQPGSGEEMPFWIPKLLWRIAFLTVGVFTLVWAVGRLHEFLFTIFIAFFISLALEPAVKWLHAHGWRRGPATFAVMGAFALIGIVLIALIVPAMIKQTAQLVEALPDWLAKVTGKLERQFHIDLSIGSIQQQLSSLKSSLATSAANVAGTLFGVGAKIVGVIFRMMTIGLFTFYFVADGPRFRRAVCSVLPRQQQQMVLSAWEVAIDKTGGYLYSRLLLATISAVISWAVMAWMGLPFALPLAIWVGIISQFIPTVGTYIAMFAPLVVALFTDPVLALWLLIYFTIYQQIENYVLSPRITAKTMELHPAIAFGSALVGATLWGPVGAFLALPVVATLQSGIFVYFVERHDVIDSELTTGDAPLPQKPDTETEASADDGKARRRRFFGRTKD